MPISAVGGQLLGIGLGGALSQIGNAQQLEQQQALMQQQYQNQIGLNLQGAQIARDNWDYTNYENQRKHMEKAGLNVGLMYGNSGSAGGTLSSGSGGSAASGNAPQNVMGMALQGAQIASQTRLNEAQAQKLEAETQNIGEKTTTEINSRDIMIENMRQSGIGQWFENIKTSALRNGIPENGKEIMNEVYNYGASGYDKNSPEIKKFEADLFKTEAEKMNLDANALLTNEKAKGYWQELLIATKNSDSQAIQAAAQKLASEWNTGEFTNWKTWTELGIKAVGTVGDLIKSIKGPAQINKTTRIDNWNNR